MDRSSHLYLLIPSLLLLQWQIDYGLAKTDIETDRSSLLIFKSRISLDPHNILTKSWSSESNICSWIGVTCDSRLQRVTQLNISSMDLVGTIPSEIGNLSFLASLDVSENSFHGPIPTSIFNMTNLEVLNLRNNSLSSGLPRDICKHNLHRLKSLRISYNKLYGEIPSSLQQCSQLEYLSLFSNNFSGHVPTQIGNLTLLQRLFFGSNYLSGNIPREIANLRMLQFLDFGNNKLSGYIPKEIGRLFNLVELDLGMNNFNGSLPEEIGNVTLLQRLWLNNNNLSGNIPKEIGRLNNLQILNIATNTIIGPLPREIGNLTDLRELWLFENKLNDLQREQHKQHEEEFEKSVFMHDCSKEGHPICYYVYGKFHDGDEKKRRRFLRWRVRFMEKSVRNLDFGHGGVSTIVQVNDLNNSPGFNRWELIYALQHFRYNYPEFVAKQVNEIPKLIGDIPKEIFLLNNLLQVNIGTNRLRGSLPREIGNTTIQDLWLDTNNLSGPIPSTFVNQLGLLNLALYSNNLSGVIPPSICNLRSLQILYLSYNNLEGALPYCLVNLSKSLLILHLSANKLTGILPTFTIGCSLQSIDLNGNRLNGTLPQSLENCQGLRAIDIGENDIQGVFPFWMETFPQLRILVLKSNKFVGTMLMASNTEMPFPMLQVLDVSHNAFVGSLPERYFKNFHGMIDAKENQTNDGENLFLRYIELTLTLKGLDQLLRRLLDTFTTIDLSSNGFSGTIPPSVANLKSLRYLNLSHNNIEGHIPSSLGGMSILESLDLSSNKLDGEIPGGLTNLTFLAKLNLSMNNLEGEIPQAGQLSTFDNESYVGNAGLCGFPLTKKCERSDGKPSPPHLEVESDREIEWEYVFAACGYVVGIGIISWLLLFCRSFRYKYFEKVDDVFEKIFECCQHRKK